MKKLRKITTLLLALLLVVGVGFTTITNAKSSKKIIFGVAPGPYGDLIKKAIQPQLEKKGYKVSYKEFNDYVQPDLALANGEIDVNLFQHAVYLKKFSADHGLKLSAVINVPTAGAGIYSKKIKSIKQLKSGSTVAISNDPTNLARALKLLASVKLITIKKGIDPTKASENDIDKNPKKLKITPVEAAQIPRTLESVDIAVINGNFAIDAKIPLSSALVKEVLTEQYKNVIAVKTADLNKQFVKDIKSIVKSAGFKKVIDNKKYQFKDFQKPNWLK